MKAHLDSATFPKLFGAGHASPGTVKGSGINVGDPVHIDGKTGTAHGKTWDGKITSAAGGGVFNAEVNKTRGASGGGYATETVSVTVANSDAVDTQSEIP
jgi:hypothetical protein